MGLFSGIIRLQMLKSTQLDLEYKMQGLQQTKMQIATQCSELVTIGTDLDPESPEFRHIEDRKQKLQLMEKKIDAEIARHQTILKIAEAEMDSVHKVIDKSIERSFKYG